MPTKLKDLINISLPGRRAIHEPRTHLLGKVTQGITLSNMGIDAAVFRKNLINNPDRKPRDGEIPTQPPDKTLPPAVPWAR